MLLMHRKLLESQTGKLAAGLPRSSWFNRNPHLYCHQVDYTNSPHIIMQNEKVVSINNTTQNDLQGQAASESDGHRHLSGTGGQLQFVRGAYASRAGKSFICLSSTYEKRGERRSRIVFTLTPGNIVTTPRSDVMYVVTEFGMVNLKGKCVAERAKAIISTRASRFPRRSGTTGLCASAHPARGFVSLPAEPVRRFADKANSCTVKLGRIANGSTQQRYYHAHRRYING
jgi:hypothetical protein